MNTLYAQVHYLAGLWVHWMLPMAWQVTLLALVVWGATSLMRKSSAAFRHALWLLVFLKLILPPSLAAPWSADTLADGLAAALTNGQAINSVGSSQAFTATGQDNSGQVPGGMNGMTTATRAGIAAHPAMVLMTLWGVGACALFSGLVLQYRRYMRRTLRDCRPADEALMTLLTAQAAALGVRRPFSVLVSSSIRIPAVFGFWHPTILMPASAMETVSDQQFCNLVRHELAHIQRHDVELGWLISAVLCCYWFHPAAWVANLYIRREREMACDDMVLYSTRQEGKEYAATIIRMAELFDDQVPAGAGFLGMLEISSNLLQRIRSVLDGTRARRFTWRSGLAVLLFMGVLIPMGPWGNSVAAPNPSSAAPKANQPVQTAPTIISSTPAHCATEVDPALDHIEATFDQDMAQGFSWTGGPPYFPKTTGSPRWKDARTCILPVQLEPGKIYRVGVNSASYKNFESAPGVPVRPRTIVFATRGADAALLAALNPPKAVLLVPENGANGVDPAMDKLMVTFDCPMDSGFAWTGGGEDFPETAGKAYWSDDKKTCILPVKLKPNWTYRFGLNSPDFIDFQSTYGLMLEPIRWQFSTGPKQ